MAEIDVERSNNKTVEFVDPLSNILDTDWLKTAFIVEVDTLHDEAKANIFSSYADRYFLDSTVGGSIAINPPYQFTRYADIPRKGRMLGREDLNPRSSSYNLGMGRYYAEAIESNAETLILEFGVPEFQSIFSFFSRAVDYNKSIVATEGRSLFFYNLGKGIGYAAQLVALNITTVLIYAGIAGYKTLFGNGDTRYYHMKPSMPQYWGAVNSIVTYMATDRGILTPTLMKSDKERLGMPIKIGSDTMNAMNELLPDVFKEGNYIDVFAVAQRSQVLINEQLIAEIKTFREGRFTKSQIENALNSKVGKLKENPSYEEFRLSLEDNSMFNKPNPEDIEVPQAESASGNPEDYQKPDDLWTYLKLPIEKASKYMGELGKYTLSTMKKGGGALHLNVTHVGSISDSFSNSVKDIPSKDKLNSLGGAARDIRFSMSGGNILGSAVQDVTNAAKDVAMGTLDTLTFGLSNVVQALLGGGNITMPKMWADSDVNVAKITYKIVAAPPYGNTITKLMDMDMVLASILAGMLPQSVGQSSYTSPFLCKAFLRGRQNIDFGMITDCTVTRGINNVPYDKDGKTLGLEISFTITDFSEIIAAPTHSGIFGAYEIGLDENNALNKFLSTLVGRDYHTSRYIGKNALLNSSRAIMGAKSLLSPAYLGMMGGDTLFGRVGSISMLDTTGVYLRDSD